ILRMKHHDLRSRNLVRMKYRVIELPTPQLLPILVGQPISIPERRANIGGVAGIGSLGLLRTRKNRPIHHRTIGNRSFDARIKRTENRRRPAKTSPNHKQLIQRHSKAPPKRKLSEFFRQSANHIQDIFMRRLLQKLSATLPRSPIAWIKHPVSLLAKKFRQSLFARNRRHPVAKNNRPSSLPRSSRRQELSDNIALESCPEHSGA